MLFSNISQAKATLSRLLEHVAGGEEVVIGKAGKPVARLIPYNADPRERKGGQWRGKIKIAEDFDELSEEILRFFKGEPL